VHEQDVNPKWLSSVFNLLVGIAYRLVLGPLLWANLFLIGEILSKSAKLKFSKMK
jgi:hypothetical protein